MNKVTRAMLGVALVSVAAPIPRAPAAPMTLADGWQLQDASRVTATGDVISQTNYQPLAWYAATVPGTVLTTLVNAGVYPEPLYGTNNSGIPDSLCRTSYWYRTVFTVPQSYAGSRVWLNFNGINYSANVWVNGVSVGTITGAFARGIFDVTSCVNAGASNALAVYVQPEPNPGAAHQKTIATGTGPNGGVTASDGPTFLCSVGWDWIPTIRDRETGIWQDVTLSASGPVTIQNPYVTSQLPLPATNAADLTVQVTLRNATSVTQTGILSGVIESISFQQAVSLGANAAQTVTFAPATTPALHLLNPRLWWPNGCGPQNLYTLHLSFSTGASVSDTQDVSFGIRQLTYTLPGSTNLALSVNGVPVMARGGDWGMDDALKRVPRERLDAQIRLHQLANYNIIRNWVGQSTSEALYELCDQYGILLWDEFFQPNPADGPDPIDTNLYLANVQEKILRFRNHPSIALWCGRNEGNPSPAAVALGDSNLVATLDPVRLYQPSSTSGRGVNSGGPYDWQPPRNYYSFGEAFKTEIGSTSVPTLEAIHAMMPSNDWEVINDDWAEHDFCGGGRLQFPGIMASRYGPLGSLADFVRKSQVANYECYRAMYEGRFAKLFQPATGVITWMSHPAQPSFVFQIYSYDLEPNAALFGVRKACEPVHVQLNQSTWHLMVINQTPQTLSNLTARSAVYNLDGSLQYSQTNTLTAAASAATDLGLFPFPGGLSAVHFVRLELRGAQTQLLSDNFYWRETVQDNFQALNNLPLVTLGVQATWQQAGSNLLINATVTNPSPAVALAAHLQLRQANSGQRVLPVFYSDNYISLLPGESRALTIQADAAALNGDAPLLAVDGWNITANASPPSGNQVGVAPNTAAQATSGPPITNQAPAVIRVNAGGGPVGFVRFGAPDTNFVADTDYSGGSTASTTNSVDASAANAAPPAVYQTERWGPCTYTFPVTPNWTYLVRLHFAEVRYVPGQRQFNAAINSQLVLSNYDIAAEAGQNRAVVKDFSGVTPNLMGNIVVAFSLGTADQPKVCGLEVFPVATNPPAPLSVTLSASPPGGSSAPLLVQFTGQATGATFTPYDTTDDHLGTVTAQGQNNGLNGSWEVATNAFDDNPATKWLDFATNNPATRASWIQYQYTNGQQCVVSSYTLTSANDASARDPANWRLLGSNDGGASWTTLDTQTNQVFPNRFQTLSFPIRSPAAFNLYRLQIDSVANPPTAGCVQLAEIELLILPGYSYYWSFGDGATSTAQNPQHTFTNTGNYLVTLGVVSGLQTGTNTLLLTIGPPLTATLTASPALGATPLTVRFAAHAAGGNGARAPYSTTAGLAGIVTAQGDNPPNETAPKAFDNTTATKWLDFANAYPATRSSWIQYQYANSIQCVVSAYTVTSANDEPQRDPANWHLLASNDDGSTWTTLDVQTNQVFASRYQTLPYSLTNRNAYNLYRFTVDSVAAPGSANSVQLSELEFIGNAAYSYAWSFGDGATSAAQNPQHTYASNGTYLATVTVSDGVATATASTTVTAQALLLAASPPALGRMTLSWPSWGSNCTLYSATNLVPPVQWEPVTEPVNSQGGTNTVSFTNGPGNRFFQLRSP